MFSTKRGREDLSDTVGYQRLAVVILNRKHAYVSMEQVKGLKVIVYKYYFCVHAEFPCFS